MEGGPKVKLTIRVKPETALVLRQVASTLQGPIGTVVDAAMVLCAKQAYAGISKEPSID